MANIETQPVISMEEELSKINELKTELYEKNLLIEMLKTKIALYENKKKKECENKTPLEVPSLDDYIFPTIFKPKFIRFLDIRRGMYILLQDYPCKVVDVKRSMGSKHGNCKVNVTGICLLNNKKYNETMIGLKYCLLFEKIEEIIKIDSIIDSKTFQCSGRDTGTITVHSTSLNERDLEQLSSLLSDPEKIILGIFTTIPVKIKDKEYTSNLVLDNLEIR